MLTKPFLFGTQSIDGNGHLTIGGCDTVELCREFGTPLYVLDEKLFRDKCTRYVSEFNDRYEPAEIAFAGKSLLTTAVARIVHQQGVSLDVASAGELYTALKADFPPDRIKLHGNFKSDQLLRMAVDNQVGRIVVDSITELDRLSAVAAQTDRQVDILIRVGPGVKTHAHTHVQTGQEDSKFGLSIASGAAMEALLRAISLPTLNVRGIHCHIGSQLFALDSLSRAAELMVAFASEVKETVDWQCHELDLGGGLGIAYTPEDAPPTIAEAADAICSAIHKACEKHQLPKPKLILEPGRSIAGPAGTTLYTVGPVKHIPGVRTYVTVDGGLSDNPRPALYEAEYTATLANRADQPKTLAVRVAGSHCETDTLIPDTTIQEQVQEGDIMAVFCTGAYHHSMASNYNRFTRPAMVLVTDGTADIIYQRETLDDLIAHDVIPERLKKQEEAISEEAGLAAGTDSEKS